MSGFPPPFPGGFPPGPPPQGADQNQMIPRSQFPGGPQGFPGSPQNQTVFPGQGSIVSGPGGVPLHLVYHPEIGLVFTPYPPPVPQGEPPVLPVRDHNPHGIPVVGYWCCQCRALHKYWVGISNRNDCLHKHPICPQCGNLTPINELTGR
jgi:hypothetical protein